MFRANNPGLGEVGRILGERWKALNEKQRAPYEAKAATDKKRYEDEKAAYNVSLLDVPKIPCDNELTGLPRRRSLSNIVPRWR